MENPHLLVVATDRNLEPEFKAALAGVSKWSPVTTYAHDLRQGVELARNRRPDIVCVPMDRDVEQLKRFAEDLTAASPESVIVALFRREMFSPDDNESAIIIDAMRSRVSDFLRRPVSSGELQQLFD